MAVFTVVLCVFECFFCIYQQEFNANKRDYSYKIIGKIKIRNNWKSLVQNKYTNIPTLKQCARQTYNFLIINKLKLHLPNLIELIAKFLLLSQK